ncbi:hypothetical protein CEXT_441781 [Caerostris extrusa]|uniref:Uncharacterized protein n=1 Tax=Caerostris extrusa TaxID=172846 RepID=A0AAV4X9R8_CAEEX|nr:hypothetical protein CEXT_441781 [Caerostris extrusa]
MLTYFARHTHDRLSSASIHGCLDARVKKVALDESGVFPTFQPNDRVEEIAIIQPGCLFAQFEEGLLVEINDLCNLELFM